MALPFLGVEDEGGLQNLLRCQKSLNTFFFSVKCTKDTKFCTKQTVKGELGTGINRRAGKMCVLSSFQGAHGGSKVGVWHLWGHLLDKSGLLPTSQMCALSLKLAGKRWEGMAHRKPP